MLGGLRVGRWWADLYSRQTRSHAVEGGQDECVGGGGVGCWADGGRAYTHVRHVLAQSWGGRVAADDSPEVTSQLRRLMEETGTEDAWYGAAEQPGDVPPWVWVSECPECTLGAPGQYITPECVLRDLERERFVGP